MVQKVFHQQGRPTTSTTKDHQGSSPISKAKGYGEGISSESKTLTALEAARANAVNMSRRSSLTSKFKGSMRSLIKPKKKEQQQHVRPMPLMDVGEGSRELKKADEELVEGGEEREEQLPLTSTELNKPKTPIHKEAREMRQRVKEIEAMIANAKVEMDQLQTVMIVKLQALVRGFLVRQRQRQQLKQKASKKPLKRAKTEPVKKTKPKEQTSSTKSPLRKASSKSTKSDNKEVLLAKAASKDKEVSKEKAKEEPEYSWSNNLSNNEPGTPSKKKVTHSSKNKTTKASSSNKKEKSAATSSSTPKTPKKTKSKRHLKTGNKKGAIPTLDGSNESYDTIGDSQQIRDGSNESNDSMDVSKQINDGSNEINVLMDEKSQQIKDWSNDDTTKVKDGSNNLKDLSSESMQVQELNRGRSTTAAAMTKANTKHVTISEETSLDSRRRQQDSVSLISSPDEYEENLFQDDVDDDDKRDHILRTVSSGGCSGSMISQITDESLTTSEQQGKSRKDTVKRNTSGVSVGSSLTSMEHDWGDLDHEFDEEDDGAEEDDEEDFLNLSVMATKGDNVVVPADELKQLTITNGKKRRQPEDDTSVSVLAIAPLESDDEKSDSSEDSRDSYAYSSRYDDEARNARRRRRRRGLSEEEDADDDDFTVMAITALDDIEVSDWEMELDSSDLSDESYDDEGLTSGDEDAGDYYFSDDDDDDDLSDTVMAVAEEDHDFSGGSSGEDESHDGSARDDDMSITSCESDLPKHPSGGRRRRRRRARDEKTGGYVEADEDISVLSSGTANKRQKKSQNHDLGHRNSKRKDEKRSPKTKESRHHNTHLYAYAYDQYDSDEASRKERRRRQERAKKIDTEKRKKRRHDPSPFDDLIDRGEEQLQRKLAEVSKQIDDKEKQLEHISTLKLQAWARGMFVRSRVDLDPKTIAARKIQAMVRSALRIARLRKKLDSVRTDHTTELQQINESKKERMDDFKNFIEKNDDMDTRVKMVNFLKKEIAKQHETSENLAANIKSLKGSNVELQTANSNKICSMTRVEIEVEEKKEKRDHLMKVNQQWIDAINEYKERIGKAEKNTATQMRKREILKKHVDNITAVFVEKSTNKKLYKEIKFMSEHPDIALGGEKVDAMDAFL